MTEKRTEHTDGEYRIVRPERENRFTDAEYIPQSEAPEIRPSRFTPPQAAPKPEKPRRGISAATVVAMCLICGVLGGAVGAFGVSWFTARMHPVETESVSAPAEIPAPETAHPEQSALPDKTHRELTLGIVGETVSPSVAKYYDMAQGVYVWSVSPGSAAEQAGLRPGDIIVALNEAPVSGVETLQGELERAAAGEPAALTVSRAGETLEAEIVIG